MYPDIFIRIPEYYPDKPEQLVSNETIRYPDNNKSEYSLNPSSRQAGDEGKSSDKIGGAKRKHITLEATVLSEKQRPRSTKNRYQTEEMSTLTGTYSHLRNFFHRK